MRGDSRQSVLLTKGLGCFVAIVVGSLAIMGGQRIGWAHPMKAAPKAKSVAATVPTGTVLYVRLQTPVSTKSCKKGQAITGTVAREVTTQGGAAIPLGSTVKGSLENCVQPS